MGKGRDEEAWEGREKGTPVCPRRFDWLSTRNLIWFCLSKMAAEMAARADREVTALFLSVQISVSFTQSTNVLQRVPDKTLPYRALHVKGFIQEGFMRSLVHLFVTLPAARNDTISVSVIT